MARLFDDHFLRDVRSLNGVWNFRTDPKDEGVTAAWFRGLPSPTRTGSVPSVWNEEAGLLSYEGAVWYERELETRGGVLRFCFDAVMTEARVWFDGIEIGSHYGGFTAFSFLVPDVAAGKHRLTVRVDNRFDEHSIPQKNVDWYHFGGIVREVRIETLRGLCVLNDRLEYTLSEDLLHADGHFVLKLYNAEPAPVTDRVTVTLGEKTVFDGPLSLEGREEKEVALPAFSTDARLWDPADPYLYDVEVRTSTDDLRDRVGFRKVEVRDGKFLLNGKATELRGVNRHEEYPGFGFAFPQSRMAHDLDLIAGLGANAVRGSHYPNSQLFVDLMDQRGMLFWSEIPIWGVGFSQQALGDPIVSDRGAEMHREMVEQYYNHPCIVIWGMHNEILSDTTEAYRLTARYSRFLREKGGNRAVVYASNHPMEDICFDFSDILCLNMYFGWYSGKLSAWNGFLESFKKRRAELGMEQKPIVFSEFGAAALYGCHDEDDVLWSEEYQAKLLSYCLSLFHDDPAVAGCFLWQFCDIRTYERAGVTNRARGFNNKGIFNEYRKPKLAAKAVGELYRSFAKEKAD